MWGLLNSILALLFFDTAHAIIFAIGRACSTCKRAQSFSDRLLYFGKRAEVEMRNAEMKKQVSEYDAVNPTIPPKDYRPNPSRNDIVRRFAK